MDVLMDELNDLLKSVWGPQKWILEGWNQITDAEKQIIKIRLDDMFKNGLPFEILHDKLIYIHIFAFLAQVNVIAIQIPLKFESKMTTLALRQQMQTQLLDEIFHSLIFSKILYLLCEPYAYPPNYAENVKKFCDFIRDEACHKVAAVLLNLVAEGWIQELFKCLQQHNVAPKVFDAILEDASRHVSETDLYCQVGLPDKTQIAPKLACLEELLVSCIFYHYNMSMSMTSLIGQSGMCDYLHLLNQKHKRQLKRIDLKPGNKWRSSMQRIPDLLGRMQQKTTDSLEIEMSPVRKLLMTQWNDPVDPTMVGQFNLDITCLDFFNKKYPPETLTTLMLQTISQLLVDYPEYQVFMRDKKLYQHQNARVSLVVKLPGCADQMGTITFQDCHKLTVQALSARIKQIVAMMVYCYKKREQVENEHPGIASLYDNLLDEMKDPVYRPVLPEVPGVCLSNNGAAGYIQGTSPLLSNETSKITLFEVQRTPVWSKISNTFEARDLLPVSVSVDHRVYGGDLPTPKALTEIFQDVFQRMNPYEKTWLKMNKDEWLIKKMVDRLLAENLEFGYMTLMTLQTMWPEYIIYALKSYGSFKNNLLSAISQAVPFN